MEFIDSTEAKILAALEKRPHQSLAALSASTGLPVKTVTDYCEALQQERILISRKRDGLYEFSLSPEAVDEDAQLIPPRVPVPEAPVPPTRVIMKTASVKPVEVVPGPAVDPPRKFHGVSWVAAKNRFRVTWTESGRQQSLTRWGPDEELVAVREYDRIQMRLGHPEKCNFRDEEEEPMAEERVIEMPVEIPAPPIEHFPAPVRAPMVTVVHRRLNFDLAVSLPCSVVASEGGFVGRCEALGLK